MPPYRGVSQVIELIRAQDEDWAQQYAEYLAIKEADDSKTNNQEDTDNDFSSLKIRKGDEDWAMDYAKYCAEKEKDSFEESTDKEQMDESDGEDEEDWQVAYAKHCAKKEKELDSKGM
mmetsp:Transcript_6508/g.9622  ORF Transcript_6508/g.9622 Transcript_6508/m.9622 type:complete len:118 (+) Transcript_6508:1036-1389(+)